MPETSWVVYGAGAVGGVIGARLHLAGQRVTLVARGAHLDRIREDGLVLDAADGRHVVRAPATDTAADVDWAPRPVVLVTVKSHQTAAALADLADHAPQDVVVVCAQNGVGNERGALRLFERTYAITVMLPAGHLQPGVVVQGCHPTPGLLDVGRFPTGTDDVTDAVASGLRAAGFESEQRPDVMAWKHRKLVLNLGNAVDAICVPGPDADELTRRARTEGEAVLAAAGVPMVTAAADRERRGDRLRPRHDRPGEEGRSGSSTYQSVVRGGGTEVDHLAGEIVLQGRLHGVAAPVNALLQRVTRDAVRRGAAPRSVDAGTLLEQIRAQEADQTMSIG